MSNEIKTLTPLKRKAPALWTMFLDATDPPAYSYSRIVGFIVLTVFMAVTAYLSIVSGTLVVPPKEWVFIVISFALMKPVQRFAETKDNESQLNYEFQMAQLSMGQNSIVKPETKTVDNSPSI